MIIYETPQGDDGWLDDRIGCITASMAGEIRKVVNGLDARQAKYVELVRAGDPDPVKNAGYKNTPRAQSIVDALEGRRVGDWTEKAKDYAFRLAIERISGQRVEGEDFDNAYARRGRELEPEARSAHEFLHDVTVEQVGFISTDDRKYGCSADGFIDRDPGVEYKCYTDAAKLRRILLADDLSDAMDQMQFSMWVTGCKAWVFGLYCPALASIGKSLTIHTVERDEAYIEALEADMVAFDGLVESYIKQLKGDA